MTCIVGLVKDGTVYLGGDAAGSNGHYVVLRKDPKVFQNGQFGIGYTSSFRMGDILQYSWTAPVWRPAEDKLEKFMRTTFIDSIRNIFKEKSFGQYPVDKAQRGGTFLVGVAGRLFEIEDDLQVGESADDYASVGSGYAFALGSLHTTQGLEKLTPANRLTSALEAAATYSTGVSAPFKIIEITQ